VAAAIATKKTTIPAAIIRIEKNALAKFSIFLFLKLRCKSTQ
jgi:hypothetical protein